MAESSGAKIMQPPTKLANKVKRGASIDPAKAIENANAIVTNVAKEFAASLTDQFAELDRLFTIYKQSNSAEDLDVLFRRIHNLRGQGTTLGFPLISRIGSSFCRYIIERNQSIPTRPGIIDQHLAALRCVYQQGIDGADDGVSQQVAAALEHVVSQELQAKAKA
jgi:chemotaxis protein histidine kinase CheA